MNDYGAGGGHCGAFPRRIDEATAELFDADQSGWTRIDESSKPVLIRLDPL
jgi:hypothetical protein